MNIRAQSDWILVRKCEPDARTPGGIALPQNRHEEEATGIVVAAGPGRSSFENVHVTPMQALVGDKVLFDADCAGTVAVDGELLFAFREQLALIAILTPEPRNQAAEEALPVEEQYAAQDAAA